MKNIGKIFMALISVLLLNYSCQDAYEIVQDGESSPDAAINTINDMKLYLNGIYGNLDNSNEIAISSIFTDELGPGRGSGGQYFDFHRFILDPSNDYVEGMWFAHYLVINRVNRLLDLTARNVPVPTDATELASYNDVLAQARALRAYSYFQLVSHFSTNPSDDNALGVMFFTNVPAVSDELPRVNNGVIYTQIEDDLLYATNNLATTTTSYFLVNKQMINALRARMYLTRKNYTLAKQYAESVINTSGLTLTSPTPVPTGTVGSSAWMNSFSGTTSTNPYRKMFNDTSQGEVVFALSRQANATSSGSNLGSIFNTNTSTVSGSPYFEVGRRLFNLLNEIPGDVRRYNAVDPTSIINPSYATDPNYQNTDVLIVDKYPGKTTSGYPLRNDAKIFRLSEMYLILGECYANSGSLNGASNSVASVIKLIRDKRNCIASQALPVYASATDAIQDILLERRKELCFEGFRYSDLKRLAVAAGVSIDRDATDDALPSQPLTIPNTDYRFTLPIPQAELEANPTCSQNPGY